ncbi:MAG: protein-export chaperone SecB, partial [Gammaproteobacteria bacterium]|nr:protein-export chaperone SecB [Gammaproteobacteria bacterium]
EMAFLVEIQQAGIFTAKGFKESDLERILATVCPNILFPYARECIDALLVKGSFPAIMLSPINFEALYEQGKAQQTTRDAAPPTSETVQ